MRPRAQVDIVIVSCSCYAPTPSMAACLVNRFRMRPDVLTYHMAGMGCSSSLVCVDLAKRLLQARWGHLPAHSCVTYTVSPGQAPAANPRGTSLNSHQMCDHADAVQQYGAWRCTFLC